MAATYGLNDRTSLVVTNCTNAQIDVFDERTTYHFGPNEEKTLAADLAVRLNGQNSNLKLPDQGSSATGVLFGKEAPGSGAATAQKV
jgi:hypothetical protein